jgi:hypothetical protein
MIEECLLSAEQIEAIEGRGEWFRLTQKQHDFIRACAPDQRCMFIGEKLVRMSVNELKRMFSNALNAALWEAVRTLDLQRDEDFDHYDMDEVEMGDRCVRVTAYAKDGKSAAAIGPLVLPTELH